MYTRATWNLVKPKNDKVWEYMVRDAMCILWKDRNAELFGSNGQWQHGADAYGTRDGKTVIVQAKNMGRLSKAEAWEEIRKAEKFQPPVQEFYFAISGDSQSDFTEFVLELSKERVERDAFPVYVKFFDDIVNLLADSEPYGETGIPQLIFKYWKDFFISPRPAATKSSLFPESDWWRLLLDVQKSDCGTGEYEVYTGLVMPDGSFRSTKGGTLKGLSDWPDDSTTRGKTFRLSELADLIVDWYQDAALAASTDDQESSEGFVVLSLPVELLAGEGVHVLLRRISAACENDILDHIPLILACSSRQAAERSRDRQMKQALQKARSKSQAIVKHSEAGGSSLSGLKWLLLCDANANPPASRGFRDPGIGGKSHHSVCICSVFDESILPVRRLNCQSWVADREALLMGCTLEPGNKKQWSQYEERMKYILYAGIPLVLIDGPHCLDTHSRPTDDCPEHPMDTFLSWTLHEFSSNYITLHKPLPMGIPQQPHAVRHYLLKSLVFWDDHRYLPPDGSREENLLTSVPFIPNS
jgi:hypothetical protein